LESHRLQGWSTLRPSRRPDGYVLTSVRQRHACSGSSTPSPGSPPAEVDPILERLYAQKRSLLDLRQAEIQDIRALVSSTEYGKLDQHLTSLRELERLIPMAGPTNGGDSGSIAPMPGGSCAAPSIASQKDMPTLVQAMTELTFQAINCDLSRVVTLQWDASSLAFLGISQGHHELQHAPTPDFTTAQAWYMDRIGALMQRFKGVSEGNGTLLSNSAILAISEMNDGRAHTAVPIHAFVAGQLGGKIKTGGDSVGNQSSLNDFYVSLARGYGVNINSFGSPALNKSPLSLA